MGPRRLPNKDGNRDLGVPGSAAAGVLADREWRSPFAAELHAGKGIRCSSPRSKSVFDSCVLHVLAGAELTSPRSGVGTTGASRWGIADYAQACLFWAARTAESKATPAARSARPALRPGGGTRAVRFRLGFGPGTRRVRAALPSVGAGSSTPVRASGDGVPAGGLALGRENLE